MLHMSSVMSGQYGQPTLYWIYCLCWFFFLKCPYSWSTYFYYPWVPVDIISGFIVPWIFFSMRSDLIAPSFEILMISIKCLPGFFLAPPTPIPIHNPTIIKILSCFTVSLFFQGNLMYLKQQNLYSFLLAFWLLLLVWSFELNFLR